MPIATNAQGQAVRLDESGQWVPTQLATNPKTNERMALDGDKWVPLAPSAPQAPQAAPRWDLGGDIGRAAGASWEALKGDIMNALPSDAQRATDHQNNDGTFAGFVRGQRDMAGRVAGLAKAPLDALGVITSPITGALHAGFGSALSYLPTLSPPAGAPPVRPLDDPSRGPVLAALGRFEKNYLPAPDLKTDPKQAGDQIVDNAMFMLAPDGLGNIPKLSATAQDAAAANAARKAAINTNKAADRVNARAAQDQLTPEAVAEAQRAANAGGDQVTLMDLGNKNVRGLAGAVHRAPGPAGKVISDFLDARDKAATPNLTKDIQGNVASGSTYDAAQDLVNSRSAAARPAYQEVEAIGPVHSDRLQEFMSDPEIQVGLRRGLKLERQNARSENRPFVASDYAVTGYKDGNLDEPIFAQVPTMKSLMVANEGLGAQLADPSMTNQMTGRLTKDGLALKNYRNAFQNELDSLSGGKYKTARDIWSGPAQSMEALQDGRQHFTRTESNAQIKAEFSALTPGDKDFYRMGAAEAKVDSMKRSPFASDKSKKVINSDQDEERFRMLFDSPAQAQQFIDAVARKRQMFDTKNSVMGNSATAGRLVEDDNHGATAALHAARGAAHAFGGNILGAAHSFLSAKRDLGFLNNPDLNSEIARILTDPNLSVGNGNKGLIGQVPVPNKQRAVPFPALIDALTRPSASQNNTGR